MNPRIKFALIVSLKVNEITFEKVLCEKIPNTTVAYVMCDFKYIKRGFLRLNMHMNFSEPMYDLWGHFVLYYRFNGMTYSKFPIDLWENACDWLKGKKSWILDWSAGKVLNYTNLNHSCPYQEIYMKVDNISINTFNIEQM